MTITRLAGFVVVLGACQQSGKVGDDSAPSTRYHPDGWADPLMHGPATKLQEDNCLACHGDDLQGGTAGVSCQSCHTADWTTDCVFCHGGTDNTTGAPPRDFLGETDPTLLSYPPHTKHVTETIHPAFDCDTCHVKPVDVFSEGHLFVGDTTPGASEVTLVAGLSPAGTYDGTTCSNLYCHGTGLGNDGTMKKTDKIDSCTDCHPSTASSSTDWSHMSGDHDDHLREGISCQSCHPDASSGTEISDPTVHVDGKVDLAMSGIDYTDGKCTGTCHYESHSGRTW